ncbi:MAG: transposase, partial [Oscillospiraceae bacterium]|nr:transposase [Oscillospiraceae bacterium]
LLRLKILTIGFLHAAIINLKWNCCKITEKYGFNLIFLPPYSPELNPIEKYWFVLKHRIKSFLRINISLDDSIHYVLQYP